MSASPEIDRIHADHALLGMRVQVVLRLFLAVFLVLAVLFDPPASWAALIWTVVGCYLVWAVATVFPARHPGPRTLRWAWSALFVDLAAVTAVAVLAAYSDTISWTSDVLLTGFALIPMAAATQLRPAICAAVAIPATVVFFGASVAARPANGEPWSLVLLHTLVIGGLAVGAIGISRLQRSRVETIAGLAADRARLLDDVLSVDRRARRDLAEALHDGVLQYVLSARGELGAVGRGDSAAADRVDEALRESSGLLRSTLTSLHPAVLEQHGLAVALGDLATSTAAPGLVVIVDTAAWPPGPSPIDEVLYATARELLTNVVKHARARRVEMTLEVDDDGGARLVVVDDGVGMPAEQVRPERLAARLAEGHLGLSSRRVRLAAVGGTLSFAERTGGGTVAIAALPLPD
ncbi:sensor histidine kinase [Gordonia sp. (in: high G+C Gram-positive bacteria)]|uniref:sensor histidine kinase n=1 Tax=Gordonia sp. (in: high G+C Gram-positive bacteria) TaxID=84139 RepID=UPI00352752CB